jgi:small-conductance mechanosensitive channel
MTNLTTPLAHRFLGTTVQSWLIAAALAISIVLVLTIARRFALRRFRRWAEATKTRVDDIVVSLIESLRLIFFVAIGLWVAVEYVTLSSSVQRFARVAISLCALLQVGLGLQALVRRLARGWAPADSDGATRTAASASAFLASLTIWSLLVISALSLLGFEISALVAGLGVGGVAAALAVQNILGDLFASLSIYFDRPFNLGDFIIVDSEMGTVEKIGLRTTRVRALSGEEIVFANGDLTKSRVRNFKRMAERRVQFGFGVEYTTQLEQLREIPQLIANIIAAREGTRFDRAHFKEYGDFALNFEVVFFVLSPDYNVFMDHQQAINLEIFAAFAQRGIQFAFPTQKVLLTSEAARG